MYMSNYDYLVLAIEQFKSRQAFADAYNKIATSRGLRTIDRNTITSWLKKNKRMPSAFAIVAEDIPELEELIITKDKLTWGDTVKKNYNKRW